MNPPEDPRQDNLWERNKIRNFIASSKLEGIILDPDGEMQRKEDAYWAERDKRKKNAAVS